MTLGKELPLPGSIGYEIGQVPMLLLPEVEVFKLILQKKDVKITDGFKWFRIVFTVTNLRVSIKCKLHRECSIYGESRNVFQFLV